MKISSLFSVSLQMAIAGLFLQSCSSGAEQHTSTPISVTANDSIPAKENFATGVIIDKVVCKSDTSQNYTLYLPKNYSVSKTYPVLFIFDAHGDGKLPITLYKDLAERYGYILAGSNNSQNGISWDDSKIIADKLFADVQNRVAVNNQRIYLLGFSGGARVANGLAITNGIVNGVICCGAAAPAMNSAHPRSNYSFFGIAGTKDFNYTEMRRYDMVDLSGYSLRHTMISFEGKHEWPPIEILDQAIWWMELNEMSKTPSYKNDSLISQHLKPVLKQIKDLKEKNRSYELYELCRKTINFYSTVADISDCLTIWKSLQNNPEVDKALRHEEFIWQQEAKLKEGYMQSLQTQDLNWWKKDIASLNQKTKTDKDKDEAYMYARVLDYLSLVCYMQTSAAMKQNNSQAADFFSQLYLIVDPTNKEAIAFAVKLDSLKTVNKPIQK